MSTDVMPPAKARIYELAAEHGILAERLPIDAWADKVTELSGNDVVHDPMEDLVVTLRRKGIITDQEATAPYWGYLLEEIT